jgi:uncharacterized protein
VRWLDGVYTQRFNRRHERVGRIIQGRFKGASVAPKPAKMAIMRPSEALATQRERILAIAAAHGASNLRVFGSVANGADKEGSDIDLLVDIGLGISLFEYVGLQLDIQEALGVRVDLCTEEELHPKLKARILAEARPL